MFVLRSRCVCVCGALAVLGVFLVRSWCVLDVLGVLRVVGVVGADGGVGVAVVLLLLLLLVVLVMLVSLLVLVVLVMCCNWIKRRGTMEALVGIMYRLEFGVCVVWFICCFFSKVVLERLRF